MKVYVVKNKYNKKSNGYMTETGEFINSIWQAELFNDYETAKCYAPALCQVVECELMEKTELADHDKQVRKEVCERLDKIIEKYLCKKGRYRESLDIYSIIKQVMKENLDQTEQGETK